METIVDEQKENQVVVKEIKHKTLPELFDLQVYKKPNKVAIRLGNNKLTYAELNNRANKIAHFIQYNFLKEYKKKISKGSVIAILGKKSLDTIASILGVLKTGAAYLAINPEDPEERIEYLLQNSNAAFILHVDTNKTKEYSCFSLHIENENLKEYPVYTPHFEGDYNGIAQLIYTSGSTGAPKGVMITHQNINNRLIDLNFVAITSEDCFLQLANYAFDASTFEIFGALLNGASLALVNKKLLFDFEELTNYIKESGVTIGFFTTSFFNAIVDQQLVLLKSIKQIVFGGEAASLVHVKKALDYLGPNRLINGYGPTECTIFTSFYKINKITPKQKSIPIGMPVGDNSIYILNEQLKQVKPGEPGEICVKSLSVAKGYYKKPELTEKVFKKGLFGGNEVIYRTGDLGRINEDGILEYLGRNDNQVKLRGYRIELGEIEYHIMAHSKISFAVASIKKDRKGLGYIVAWVLAEDEIEKREIRSYLSTKVADYMLPRHIVFIDEIPLTSNGKLDKNTLPDPNEIQISTYFKPKKDGIKEERLLYALKEVLGKQNVGIDDNFFALGLDSISALHFITEAKKLKLYFSTSDIYNYPTLGELSLVTKEGVKKVIKTDTHIGEMGLTPIQKWFFNLNFSDPNYFLQTQIIKVKSIEVKKLQKAFLDLVHAHDVFKIKFYKNNGDFVQSYSNIIDDSFISIHNIKGEKNENKEIDKIEKELEEQINLERNELFKVALIKRNSDDLYHILIILHHAIVDGVSWRILVEDLIQLYQGKTILKTDTKLYWLQQLKTYAHKERTLEAVPFWKSVSEQINEFILVKNQNIIYPSHTYGSVSDRLSIEETYTLSEDCFKLHNTNVETLLITAYITSLANWIGQNKIVFMLESHGREKCVEDVDVSRTIGWFTSAYPVIATLPDDKDIGERIIAVKEQLKSIPDNGLSYGALKYLQSDSEVRNSIKDATPEAWFNYLGVFDDNQYELPKGWNLFDEGSGHDVLGSQNKHWSPFELNCSIVKKQFLFKLTYDENQFRKETINEFVDDFKANLIKIIEYCNVKKEIRYTPSDFELGYLNQNTFDKLYEKLNKKGTIRTLAPITGLQRGMLFHYLKNKESDQYYVQVKITISGSLDEINLKRKLQELIKENEIFRSIFIWENVKEPLQCTYEYNEDLDAINWNEISLTGKGQKEKEEEINHILENDRKIEFSLNEAPPIRFLLIKQKDESHTLVWTLHHILIDGWSIYHIINDLVESFQNKESRKGFHQLKSLQFHHLNRWLNTQPKVAALKFWKEQLTSIKSITPFPFTKKNEQPSPDKPIKNQEENCLKFSSHTTSKIKNLAKKYEVTLNSLFQFAWAKMLQLKNNNDTIVFGVTVSGRNHDFQDIDRIVGSLINTLPVVTKWSNQNSIHEQVQVIHKTFQKINQYSYVDLNELLKMTELKTPHLFNHILVFENHKKIAKHQNTTSDIQIEKIEEIEKTNYPITVLGSVENDCLQIKIIYDTDCFDKEMIHEKLGILQEILEYTIDNPMANTNEIEITSRMPFIDVPVFEKTKKSTILNSVKVVESEVDIAFEKEQKSIIFIKLWGKVLDQKNISTTDDFFHLGGHSLNALEISNELKRKGEEISVNDIYRHRTIESLLSFIFSNPNKEKEEVLPFIEKNEDEIFSLSPLQQRFVNRKLINRNRFNVPFLAKIKFKTSLEVINNVIAKIVEEHKSLQLRFVKENDVFKQYYHPNLKENLCDYFDMVSIKSEYQDQFISEKCKEIQSQFDLLSGKLFRVLVFDNYLNPDSKVVFLLFHHSIFDGVSLQIFINDFFRLLAFENSKEDLQENVFLSSCSYKDWVATIQNYIAGKTFLKEHSYWKEVLQIGGDIPTDYNTKEIATHRKMKALECVLLEDKQQMDKFSKSIKRFKLMPSNLLISVLYSLCNDFFGIKDLLIDVMSQQRESFFQNTDIQRTTGFFAGAYPVRLSLDKEASNEKLIQQINQTILNVPKNGLDYFILKYSAFENKSNKLLLPQHKASTLFHYLKSENIFPETSYYEQLDIPIGFTNSKDNESNYLLNITVKESANQLSIRFYYSSQHFKENTITNLMNAYKKKMYHLLNWDFNK